MNLLSSIGDTPLIRLSSIVPKSSAELWTKYEGNYLLVSTKIEWLMA